MIVLAVVGSKKSGKTTAIEALTRELRKQGHSVATLKHVSEEAFTLDTEGKDTWRHAQAGASTTIAVSAKELAIIKRGDTTNLTLEEIIGSCRLKTDVVILEGFTRLVAKDPAVHKIVAVKGVHEAVKASKTYLPILAFTGIAASDAAGLGFPTIDVVKTPHKLFGSVVRPILARNASLKRIESRHNGRKEKGVEGEP
jgi:molybdopterin-guanine dinucleotide biosynthesis protein MobB